MKPDGTEFSVLHQFNTNDNDGQYPGNGLAQGDNGVYYGVTTLGGSSGAGAVFKLSGDGTGYTVIYSFHPNGQEYSAYPSAPLVAGVDGFLYGTTYQGGSGGGGTIFKLTPEGAEYSSLHDSASNDSANPATPSTRPSRLPSD